MKWLVAILLLLVCAGSVQAGDKITADPNAGPRAEETAEAVDLYSADSRLARKITLSAPRKMVSEILSDLSAKTGITFRAGVNSQDWQVRDRRMNIFAKDLPIKDLMKSISRVMKFKWSRGGESPNWTYRLYMDRKTLLDAETKRLREEDKLREQDAKSRADILSQYEELDNQSAEQMAALRESDPFTYSLAKTGITRSLGSFFANMPVATEALAGGEEMVIAATDLSPQASVGIQSLIDAADRYAQLIGAGRTVGDILRNDRVPLSVLINRNRDQSVREMQGMELGSIRLMRGTGFYFDLPLLRADSRLGRLLGSLLADCNGDGSCYQEALKTRGQDFKSAAAEDFKAHEYGEPVLDHSADPHDASLDPVVKLKHQTPWTEDVLSAFSDAANMSVVADAFERTWLAAPAQGQELTMGEAIKQIAGSSKSNWEKRESIIEFRDRDWYRKRLEQLPQAWIDAWAATLRKTGTLEVSDLVQIAALTQDQFYRNLNSDDVFTQSGLSRTYWSGRDILRAYGSLTDSQRAAALRPDGLDLAGLSEQQWNEFSTLIARKSPSLLENKDARYTLLVTEMPSALTSYNFFIGAGLNARPLYWTVQMPHYVPPKDTSNAANK